MLKWFKKKPSNVIAVTAQKQEIEPYSSEILLPVSVAEDIVKDYTGRSGNEIENKKAIKVNLVAIYNVKQLASEIAKCLKNSTGESSEGNNASK